VQYKFHATRFRAVLHCEAATCTNTVSRAGSRRTTGTRVVHRMRQMRAG
jgi:hypothetical protein